jgi:hypothetical protein
MHMLASGLVTPAQLFAQDHKMIVIMWLNQSQRFFGFTNGNPVSWHQVAINLSVNGCQCVDLIGFRIDYLNGTAIVHHDRAIAQRMRANGYQQSGRDIRLNDRSATG